VDLFQINNTMGIPKYHLKILAISCLLFSIALGISAESAYKKTIYYCFINREMYKWANIIHNIETNNPPVTIEQKLELIDYYYGFVGYLIGKKQLELAEKYVNKADKLIVQVLKESPKNATAYSYKGSFIGYRIGISKFKAIYLGPESSAYVNKAYELDPQNIQAIIDKGNILFYSPSIFGGDKEEALKFYLKGAKLIETNKDTYQNWAYLNLLTITALAYEKTEQPQRAKLIYDKILRQEPNFYWVKVDLYPKFLAKNKM
jgi:tetratricopeptide (TPR) repeat protein